MAIGCSEPNPLAMGDTSSGGTDGTTTMTSTTIDPTTTMSTTIDPTTTMSTTNDPTTETTDDMTTSPVDTSTGAAACDTSSHRCVPDVPAGWEGPVALRYSEPAARDPGCAAPYDEPGVVVYADLLASAHNCDCACGEAENVNCSDVTLIGDDTAGCGSPLGSMDVGEDCTAMPVALQIAGTSRWRATATYEGGECEPQPTVDIGPAEFDDRVTLCGAEPDAAICEDGGICVPLPGDAHDGQICIWQLGSLDCPDDAWTQQTVLYQGLDDDRGCTVCTCGEATGDCDGTVALGTTANCVGGQAVASIGVDGDCQAGASAQIARGASITGSLTPVDPQCTPSTSVQTGSLAVTGEVTRCCLAPE